MLGGRAFRTLSMEDEFSRTGLALELLFSFPSRSVIAVLDSVAAIYGYPKYLRIDNGAEFTSKLMQLWSEEHDVELLFIQPGKPTQNACIESFNNRVRTEFLNAQWFRTLAEGQLNAHAWLHRYNTTHAHSVLGYRTPRGVPRNLRNYPTYPEIGGRMTGPTLGSRTTIYARVCGRLAVSRFLLSRCGAKSPCQPRVAAAGSMRTLAENRDPCRFASMTAGLNAAGTQRSSCPRHCSRKVGQPY